MDLAHQADRMADRVEQVALSTMHSAKGLEFDHVVILGFNAEVVQHGDEDDDVRLDGQRRLLAMAVGRARASVVLGYKPSDASRLIEFLDPEPIRRSICERNAVRDSG